jgi:very-short-patch-repair endonuclease
VDSLLARQNGVLSMAQAVRHLSRKAVRHRVASGRRQEPHPSVFVTHSGPISSAQLRWIAVLGIGDHAVPAGPSALQAAGLRGFAGTAVHILVPAGRRPTRVPPGTTLHRTSCLPAKDLMRSGRPPRTRPARSLVDAAQWARRDDDARALIAAAFQQRLVTEPDVRDVLARMPRARRRRMIASTVADAAGGAHSLAEIDFVVLCRRHRLPEPTRQVVRLDAGGRRRYLDALFEPWRVHVEIDGSQHMKPRQAWADMRRQNGLWIAGYRVLRFPAWLSGKSRPA